MKIKELKGKDILMAYDGDYLSEDFGYSCANFNISEFGKKSDQGNDIRMFDIYIENPNNISCFVAYNDDDEIIGRRMYFKGRSLLDDNLYDIPDKLGKTVHYLYGYYGEKNRIAYNEIIGGVIKNYGKNIIHTDRVVIVNGRSASELQNYFVMQIEKADFEQYPPTDFLYICPEIKAYANFEPIGEVLKSIERITKKDAINFGQAYRYKKNRIKNIDYKTWFQNNYGIDPSDLD